MRQKLLFLDGLRGLAALYVVIHHARWVLWEGYNEGYLLHPETYSLPENLLMYFFSAFKYGHEAVILFFLLSGFVIHLRYSKQLADTGTLNFDFFDYFLRRVKRIVPPLLLAIAFTFIIDSIGFYFNLPLFSYETAYSSINENINANHGITTLLGNLFFLMDIYVPVWGSNGPLWSLAFEWWFYMLYPLFLFAGKRYPWISLFLLAGLSILATAGIFPMTIFAKILGMMVIWWFGAFLADVFTGRIKISFKVLSAFSLFIPGVLVGTEVFKFQFLSGNLYFVVWGLGYLGFFSLLFSYYGKQKLRILERLKPLGDISYSLYILHMPALALMSGVLMHLHPQDELPQSFNYIPVGIAVSVVLGYFGYLLVEKPVLRINEGKLDMQSSRGKSPL